MDMFGFVLRKRGAEAESRANNNCRIRHVYHAVDIMTCGRQRNGPDAPSWKKACALHTCPACGDDQLDDHLRPLLNSETTITWMKWESVQQPAAADENKVKSETNSKHIF